MNRAIRACAFLIIFIPIASVTHGAVKADVPIAKVPIVAVDQRELVVEILADQAVDKILNKLKRTWWIAIPLALLGALGGIGIFRYFVEHAVEESIESMVDDPIQRALNRVESQVDSIVTKAAELKLQSTTQLEAIARLEQQSRDMHQLADKLAEKVAEVVEAEKSAMNRISVLQQEADAAASAMKQRLQLELTAYEQKYVELQGMVTSLSAISKERLAAFESRIATIDKKLLTDKEIFERNSSITINIFSTKSAQELADNVNAFLISRGYRVVNLKSFDKYLSDVSNCQVRARHERLEDAKMISDQIGHIVDIGERVVEISEKEYNEATGLKKLLLGNISIELIGYLETTSRNPKAS